MVRDRPGGRNENEEDNEPGDMYMVDPQPKSDEYWSVVANPKSASLT